MPSKFLDGRDIFVGGFKKIYVQKNGGKMTLWKMVYTKKQ
jgi:hypothetical protein